MISIDKPLPQNIEIRHNLAPGDVGYLIHMHGWIYEKECGYNYQFEGYVCKTFYDFLENYDTEKDRIWLAQTNREILGSIAIVGHSNTRAQLRWFIIHPDFRGIGLGSKLVNEALKYCKDKGYKHVFLETTSDQKTAIGMYIKRGFKKSVEHKNNIWSRELIEQTYELHL
jgi:ribosomal protein S18 acetylase RimI-like enzyme